jgi:hypothetical protein
VTHFETWSHAEVPAAIRLLQKEYVVAASVPIQLQVSLGVHEVCKFCLMNSTGAGRQQCGTGSGQMGGCQVAARASMSIRTALVTHDMLTSRELLARWLLRVLV